MIRYVLLRQETPCCTGLVVFRLGRGGEVQGSEGRTAAADLAV